MSKIGVDFWASEKKVGSRESGVGSRESGVGSRESGVGSRESGVGSRESKQPIQFLNTNSQIQKLHLAVDLTTDS
jgi:hypothetical protein